MQRNIAVKFRNIRFCAAIPKSRSGPIMPDLAVAEVYKALYDDGSLAPKPAIFGRTVNGKNVPNPVIPAYALTAQLRPLPPQGSDYRQAAYAGTSTATHP